jgi:hypothetical protein
MLLVSMFECFAFKISFVNTIYEKPQPCLYDVTGSVEYELECGAARI